MTDDICDARGKLPARAWTPAYDAEGLVRPGAWVVVLTRMLDLSSWPKGMRVIVRKERPHPGAQLRFTDIDGHRFTCFATSTKGGQLADLELRHRRRARCEDRIRCAKDTGLRNLLLTGYDQNQIWCEIVALACDLLAWIQNARPHRDRPPLGTQTAQAADLHRCRADRARRQAAAAPAVRTLAMGTAKSLPPSPCSKPSPPAEQPTPSQRPKKGHRARGTPHNRRDSRAIKLTGTPETVPITKNPG